MVRCNLTTESKKVKERSLFQNVISCKRSTNASNLALYKRKNTHRAQGLEVKKVYFSAIARVCLIEQRFFHRSFKVSTCKSDEWKSFPSFSREKTVPGAGWTTLTWQAVKSRWNNDCCILRTVLPGKNSILSSLSSLLSLRSRYFGTFFQAFRQGENSWPRTWLTNEWLMHESEIGWWGFF